MSDDQPLPQAADDFVEFAEPPRQRPRSMAEPPPDERPAESDQSAVDEVLARLRRERAEGKR
jgi:hypothetical protein